MKQNLLERKVQAYRDVVRAAVVEKLQGMCLTSATRRGSQRKNWPSLSLVPPSTSAAGASHWPNPNGSCRAKRPWRQPTQAGDSGTTGGKGAEEPWAHSVAPLMFSILPARGAGGNETFHHSDGNTGDILSPRGFWSN